MGEEEPGSVASRIVRRSFARKGSATVVAALASVSCQSTDPSVPKSVALPLATDANISAALLPDTGTLAAANTSDAGISDAGRSVKIHSPEKVHFVGRFVQEKGRRSCGWSGCEVRFRFRGKSASIVIDGGGPNHFSIFSDGREEKVVKFVQPGDRTIELVRTSNAEEHEIRIVRRTEAGYGISRFGDIVIEEGEIVATEEPPRLLIEFIGDSITCGTGAEGASQYCGRANVGDMQNETASYAAVTSRILQADHMNHCYSGRGIYRDAAGNPYFPFPNTWRFTFAKAQAPLWDFQHARAPEAVVINLGTNDLGKGFERDPLVSAYSRFLDRVRSFYPDATIVVAIGMMHETQDMAQARRAIESLVLARKDPRLSFFRFGAHHPDDAFGCDFHPGKSMHAKMGEALANHLRERLSRFP